MKFGIGETALYDRLSHPTRVRGLKYRLYASGTGGVDVAPHEGAWIEIVKDGHLLYKEESHPTRVRGLK